MANQGCPVRREAVRRVRKRIDETDIIRTAQEIGVSLNTIAKVIAELPVSNLTRATVEAWAEARA